MKTNEINTNNHNQIFANYDNEKTKKKKKRFRCTSEKKNYMKLQ
jgi:hypothetical protein